MPLTIASVVGETPHGFRQRSLATEVDDDISTMTAREIEYASGPLGRDTIVDAGGYAGAKRIASDGIASVQ
jgi:hypothetical protein